MLGFTELAQDRVKCPIGLYHVIGVVLGAELTDKRDKEDDRVFDQGSFEHFLFPQQHSKRLIDKLLTSFQLVG